MTLARPIVFGNWKMHGSRQSAADLLGAVLDGGDARSGGTLGVFPPATLLAAIAEQAAGSGLVVGGQDCHAEPSGAHTGSIAAPMLRDAGATAVILGHSERRHGLGETSRMVAAKLRAAQAADLMPVLCIGETEAEWLGGQREAVLAGQLEDSLPAAADPAQLVVAYEPVWAIGTGRVPELADIAASHDFIRARLRERFPSGPVVPILYGGSVKPDNARPILGIDGVDGALVGGASLDPQAFLAIFAAGGGR